MEAWKCLYHLEKEKKKFKRTQKGTAKLAAARACNGNGLRLFRSRFVGARMLKEIVQTGVGVECICQEELGRVRVVLVMHLVSYT